MSGLGNLQDEVQARALTAEQGMLSKPDGSATFSQGDTSVLAAVYGPGEVKVNKEIIDKATVEVFYKPKVGQPGCGEKFQERLVRNSCESVILASLHPRTAVHIVLQEMQNSGSLLACCINAANLALLDACVPMKFMMGAVCCMIDKDGKVIVDPRKEQENEAVAMVTAGFDSKDFNTISATAQGEYSSEQLQSMIDTCREASKCIFQFYRNTMHRKLSKVV